MKIKIFIKGLDGATYQVEVDPNDTIESSYHKIYMNHIFKGSDTRKEYPDYKFKPVEIEDYPFKLTFAGKILERERTWADSNIKEESTLHWQSNSMVGRGPVFTIKCTSGDLRFTEEVSILPGATVKDLKDSLLEKVGLEAISVRVKLKKEKRTAGQDTIYHELSDEECLPEADLYIDFADRFDDKNLKFKISSRKFSSGEGSSNDPNLQSSRKVVLKDVRPVKGREREVEQLFLQRFNERVIYQKVNVPQLVPAPTSSYKTALIVAVTSASSIAFSQYVIPLFQYGVSAPKLAEVAKIALIGAVAGALITYSAHYLNQHLSSTPPNERSTEIS